MPRDALAAGAPALHADVPDNLAMDYEYGNQAATDEAFAKAARIVRIVLHAQRIAGVRWSRSPGLRAYDPRRRDISTSTCRPRAWPTS